MANLIDSRFAAEHRIATVKQTVAQEVEGVDGKLLSNAKITHSTSPLLRISDHAESITLALTTLGHYAVILGKPWLHRHNPEIDWRKHAIKFSSKTCIQSCLGSEVVPVSLMALSALKTSQTSNPILTTTASLDHATPSAQLDFSSFEQCVSKQSRNCRICSNSITENKTQLPDYLQDYTDVFDVQKANTLPPHRPHDHTIPLVEGKSPPFGRMYPQSEMELKETRIPR